MKKLDQTWLVLALAFFILGMNGSHMFAIVGFVFLVLAFSKNKVKK